MTNLRTLLHQLRTRIIAAHMVVVVVGVIFVLLIAWLMTTQIVPNDVADRLAYLTETPTTGDLAAATSDLLETFRNSVFTAVSIAALAAIIAGVGSSLLLAREILRPLRQIASSSQRIARGHYAERVPLPPSSELAQVATNFNQMAEELENIEQQRIALIANVSHELRTPLTGLNGYLEGLMDGVFPANDETFGQMADEVRRLRRLVNDLQALSRVESGQISLHLESFSLRPVVERVLAQLKPQAEAQCVELKMVDGETAVFVHADPDRTAQVLMNLVGNAIRYTPEDGCIRVHISTDAHNATIAVQDTGIGIPATAMPYLFERFYRVDPSRTRRSGGSGIGLTISRHLVWAMGGELTAASPGEGQGSTFTFTLPLAVPAQAGK